MFDYLKKQNQKKTPRSECSIFGPPLEKPSLLWLVSSHGPEQASTIMYYASDLLLFSNQIHAGAVTA